MTAVPKYRVERHPRVIGAWTVLAWPYNVRTSPFVPIIASRTNAEMEAERLNNRAEADAARG